VTDSRMTRFFMSLREAVSLVVQASAVSENHEVFMLEMGEPVNVLDLARRMIELNGYEVGRDIEIEITGARPGERLTESVHGDGEEILKTAWPSILALRPIGLEPAMVEEVLDDLSGTLAADDDRSTKQRLLEAAAVARRAATSASGSDDRLSRRPSPLSS
jgi:FlaA1/EpsC-like NDP-sugar epimerase